MHIQIILSCVKKLLIRKKLNCRNSDKQIVDYKNKIFMRQIEMYNKDSKIIRKFRVCLRKRINVGLRIMLRIESLDFCKICS